MNRILIVEDESSISDFVKEELEYDIKIKDKNNIIREVTVDSKYGAISDFENYYYND